MLIAQGGCEEEEQMKVKTLREKLNQTRVSSRDHCDSSAFKGDTGGQRTHLGGVSLFLGSTACLPPRTWPTLWPSVAAT